MRLIKNKKTTTIIATAGLALSAGFIIGIGGWFGGGASIPSDTMTRGLVGYWSFDEAGGTTAFDGSGNSNNGTINGDPQWSTGKQGGALSFDGKDDYVDLSANSGVAGISVGSIGIWFNINIADINQGLFAYAHQNGSLFPRLNILVNTNNNIYVGRTNDSGGSFSADEAWVFTGSTTINTNTWYYLVFVQDGNEEELYINGTKEATSFLMILLEAFRNLLLVLHIRVPVVVAILLSLTASSTKCGFTIGPCQRKKSAITTTAGDQWLIGSLTKGTEQPLMMEQIIIMTGLWVMGVVMRGVELVLPGQPANMEQDYCSTGRMIMWKLRFHRQKQHILFGFNLLVQNGST
jgi:hypothetical protein